MSSQCALFGERRPQELDRPGSESERESLACGVEAHRVDFVLRLEDLLGFLRARLARGCRCEEEESKQ